LKGAALNETVAWRLLCSLSKGTGSEAMDPATPVRARYVEEPQVWLEIEAGGSGEPVVWRTSHPPTPGARDLLDLFLPVQLPGRLVLGQMGQSLDGRIATESGHSHYVTGEQDLTRLHRLRALVDAVVVGAGTVASDDPRLTVRRVEGANPVRVVIDPSARLPVDRRVFQDGAAPTVLVTGPGVAPTWEGPGVEHLPLPWQAGGDHGHQLDPQVVIEALRARGLSKVLVEGGGLTVSTFLEARALDRLHITVAPILMGSGRASITLPPIARMDEAIRPVSVQTIRLGDDVLFDLSLRRRVGKGSSGMA
jgi:diaminohydroxyphosphoribosylaminopyrimidine deaminase / 5-amino-6-(5-phosphoribosylamino)uracil reductase